MVLPRKLRRPKLRRPKLRLPRHRVSLMVAPLLASNLRTAKPHLRNNKDILRNNRDTLRNSKDILRNNKDTHRSNKDTQGNRKDIRRSKGTLRNNRDMAAILAKRLLRAISRVDILPNRDTRHRVDSPVSRQRLDTRATAADCSSCCCGSSRWRF